MQDAIAGKIIQPREYGNVKSALNYFLKFNFPKNIKIIDIGCNCGSLVYDLYKSGYKDVLGVDINADAIEEGRKKYKEIRQKLEVCDRGAFFLKSEQFDAVLMFDVIEHISDIENFLKKEVFRILKKNGMFIFQTPNKYINVPWEIINQKSFTRWKKYHYSLQTANSLKDLLKNSGFDDIVIEKNDILTLYNRTKVKDKIGLFGLFLLCILQKMPLKIYPNFWGCAKKTQCAE